MLDLFTDSKTVVVLFLIAVLGLLILANPTGKPVPAQIAGSAQQLWSLDHDGGGMYPAQDCGRNYWLQMLTPGQNPCAVRVQNPETVEEQAMKDMKQNGDTEFETDAEMLETFRDYVGVVLERIAPAW